MLTEKEFLMLELLLRKRKNGNVPINEIITHVWNGRESTIVKGNVSQLAYRLRSKLSDIGVTIQITISMNSGGRCQVHRDVMTIITKNNGIFYSFLKMLLNVNKNNPCDLD